MRSTSYTRMVILSRVYLLEIRQSPYSIIRVESKIGDRYNIDYRRELATTILFLSKTKIILYLTFMLIYSHMVLIFFSYSSIVKH